VRPAVRALLAIATILAAGRAAVAGASGEAATRAQLVARWEHAQRAAIAKIPQRKARAAAETRLAAERRGLDEGPGTSGPSDLSQIAARELRTAGRYDLAHAAAPPSPNWWQRFWTWVSEHVGKLLRLVFGRAHVSPSQAVAAGYVLLAAVTLLLLIVALRLIASIDFDRRRRARGVEPLAGKPDARALYERALRCAERERYGDAVKLLFAAAVTALELRGELEERRSATVGELRASVRARDASLTVPFDAIARPFVFSAYAERAVGSDEWERARGAYLALVPEASA